jgi:hypothetical protein
MTRAAITSRDKEAGLKSKIAVAVAASLCGWFCWLRVDPDRDFEGEFGKFGPAMPQEREKRRDGASFPAHAVDPSHLPPWPQMNYFEEHRNIS